jgi:hypothetical protein
MHMWYIYSLASSVVITCSALHATLDQVCQQSYQRKSNSSTKYKWQKLLQLQEFNSPTLYSKENVTIQVFLGYDTVINPRDVISTFVRNQNLGGKKLKSTQVWFWVYIKRNFRVWSFIILKKIKANKCFCSANFRLWCFVLYPDTQEGYGFRLHSGFKASGFCVKRSISGLGLVTI